MPPESFARKRLAASRRLKSLTTLRKRACVGSMLGVGTRQAKWKSVGSIILSWPVTVPCGAAIAAVFAWILNR